MGTPPSHREYKFGEGPPMGWNKHLREVVTQREVNNAWALCRILFRLYFDCEGGKRRGIARTSDCES
jgi:hypothetical protein